MITYDFNGQRHTMRRNEFCSVRPGPTFRNYALKEPRKFDSSLAESIDKLSGRFTDREMADILGLSIRRVEEFRVRYGIKKDTARYTEAEMNRIRAGGSADIIAAELRRSVDAVRAKGYTLGVLFASRVRRWQEWEEKMFHEGMSVRDIAKVTGRSARAVRAKRLDVMGQR